MESLRQGDLRQSPRVPWSRAARYRPTFQQQFFPCLIVNVSTGGLCFSAERHQAVGTEIAFEIDSDGTFVVTGTGCVRWFRREDPATGVRALCGVEFSSLTAESKAVIDRVIREGAT